MRILAGSIGLVVGVVIGVGLTVALIPAARFGADAAPRPQPEPVDAWIDAARVAGVPLFAPIDRGDPDDMWVHGIPGDATRPIEARYGDGLHMVQAYRDVLPESEFGRAVSVSGADDSWWHSAEGTEYLAVRWGETLVVLSGLPDDELVDVASGLQPVSRSP